MNITVVMLARGIARASLLASHVVLQSGLYYNRASMAIDQNSQDKVTYFAETDYRSRRIKFGIRDDDRARHMYVIGKTGMGKSTLLENLAIQDIQNGEGLCFIDPHGGTAEVLLSYVPEHRIKNVIYFAPFDQEFPVGLNVMEDMGRDKRPLVASGLMGAFKKVWVDAWSARMEYILNNAMLALFETPGSTLLGINRMFADKNYRNMIVNNVTDPSVRAFWVDEYAKYSDKFATEATAAIQNKVGQFAANPLIRNLVGQPKSTFDIRRLMDERKIFIVNLSKGRMGEGNANLVGSMLITKIYLAAMSRAEVGSESVRDLPPFYLYVDEFQSFANESFADILSEARKYKLSLTVAHQYIEQMSDEVRAAVFGNVGTMVSFRVGAYDAEVLEKEFAPAFTAEDMVNLGFAQIYLKLMIKGVGSPPFSAKTLNRPKTAPHTFADEVIAASRSQFARPRAEVEDEIKKWHEPIPEPPRDPNAPFVPETRKYAPGARPARPSGASAPYSGGAVPRVGMAQPPAPIAVAVTEAPTQQIPPPAIHVERLPEPSLVPENAPVATPTPVASTASIAPVVPMRPTPVQAIPLVAPVAPVVPLIPTPALMDTVQTPGLPVSAPVAPSTLHQPFKQEFKKITEEAAPLVREGGVDRPPTHVPANAFHHERHDGVSPAAYVERNSTVGPINTRPPSFPDRTPQSSLTALKSQPKKDKGPSEENLTGLKAALAFAYAKNNKAANTGITAPTHTPPPVVGMNVGVPLPVIPQSTPPQIQIPTEVKRTPSPLLEDIKSPVSAHEVPEDVLRKVLAD